MEQKHTLTFWVGALLLWGVGYATIIASYPKIYSPYSASVIVPVLMLSEIFRGDSIVFAFALGTLVIPVLFMGWSFPLLKGQGQIPKRSRVAALILTFISAVLLLVSWSYGVEYQGITHTIAMCVFNFCFWIILFFIYKANSIQRSFATNFMFHWMMFAWLGWVAFPWLGENL